MIGYHLATENSLCGMAMTQGIQRKVINIGLGMKQLLVEPRGISMQTYVESFSHKVCPLHALYSSQTELTRIPSLPSWNYQ